MKKVSLLAVAGLFASLLAPVGAATFTENFTRDPAADGWQIFGNTNLFRWDSANQVLDVTWDSTQTNSYFYLPLGKTCTKADSFYLRFDLQLNDATNFNSGMELAIGLLHFSDATNSSFSRANFDSPNVCEFDYFPRYVYDGKPYPDSVDATIIDASGWNTYFAFDNFTLNPGVAYRIELAHQAGAGAISCEVSTNGQIISSLPNIYGSAGDFQLDVLSITSYSDDGSGDSILAHGTVSNLAFATPLPIEFIQPPAAAQIQFVSDTNWVYTLQGSADLINWTAVAPGVFGNGTNLLLQATNPPCGAEYYRVSAELP